MKIYLSLIITILLLIFSFNCGINMLEEDGRFITQQLQQIQTAVEHHHEEDALLLYEQLNWQWENSYKKWAMIIDHDKLDEIQRLFIKIKIDLSSPQSYLSLQQNIAEVTYLFQAMIKTEKITWQNIL